MSSTIGDPSLDYPSSPPSESTFSTIGNQLRSSPVLPTTEELRADFLKTMEGIPQDKLTTEVRILTGGVTPHTSPGFSHDASGGLPISMKRCGSQSNGEVQKGLPYK